MAGQSPINAHLKSFRWAIFADFPANHVFFDQRATAKKWAVMDMQSTKLEALHNN